MTYAHGKYGLTTDEHKRSSKFHRMRRKYFSSEAKKEKENEMDAHAESMEREPVHPSERKGVGQGQRKYPVRKHKKVKKLTPEEEVHNERKRIFKEHMQRLIRRKTARATPAVPTVHSVMQVSPLTDTDTATYN